jgi:hypothetical protein
MVEAGKSGPMHHTPGSGKTDLDVNEAPPTQAPRPRGLRAAPRFSPTRLSPRRYLGKRLRGLPDPSNSAAFLFQPSTRSLTIPVFRMSDFVC